MRLKEEGKGNQMEREWCYNACTLRKYIRYTLCMYVATFIHQAPPFHYSQQFTSSRILLIRDSSLVAPCSSEWENFPLAQHPNIISSTDNNKEEEQSILLWHFPRLRRRLLTIGKSILRLGNGSASDTVTVITFISLAIEFHSFMTIFRSTGTLTNVIKSAIFRGQ